MIRALLYSGKKPDSDSPGAAVINVGLNNVPITSRTDLANKYVYFASMLASKEFYVIFFSLTL